MEGETLSLTREISVVGRSRECDIRLQDPAASRRHFQVEVREGGLWARDLGSSNGTYRNGRRLQGEERLRDGDVLLVGETEITVRIRTSEEEVAEVPSATTRIPELADRPPEPEVTPSRGIPVSGRDARTTVSAPPPPPPLSKGEGSSGFAGAERTEPEAEEGPESSSALLPPPPRARETRSSGEGGDSSDDLLPSIDNVDLDTGARPSEGTRGIPDRSREALSRTGLTPSPGTPRPAGFWIRLAALLVDGIVIAVAGWLVGAPFAGSAELVLSSLVSFLLGVGIPVVGWARWGTTPGKRLFGLWVCQEDGDVGLEWSQALIRWVGYLASGIPLGIGFLMVAFSTSKRGLHDRMAGTYVGRG